MKKLTTILLILTAVLSGKFGKVAFATATFVSLKYEAGHSQNKRLTFQSPACSISAIGDTGFYFAAYTSTLPTTCNPANIAMWGVGKRTMYNSFDTTTFMKGVWLKESDSTNHNSMASVTGITMSNNAGRILRIPMDSVLTVFPNKTFVAANYYPLSSNPSGYITASALSPYYLASNPSGYITSSALSPYLTASTAASTYYLQTNPANYIASINSSMVTTALGFTPYNNTNPNNYISSVSSSDITTALGYTPYNSSNPSGYISSISSGNITTALGYTPYNAANPSNYISSITSGNVTTALGYTPVTNARTVTINGTAQDLSSNRTWSVGTLVAADTNSLSSRINLKLNSTDTATFRTASNNAYASLTGSYSNPSWITSLAQSKVTYTGTTAQYIRGDGTLATLPTVSGATGTFGVVTTANGVVSAGKRIEVYSGTTNASGVYTVTFGTAYSVAPNIQASITNQSSTNQYVRIASVSTTGFTINAYSFSTNTLLGIVNLIATTVNVTGATVDVLCTEK